MLRARVVLMLSRHRRRRRPAAAPVADGGPLRTFRGDTFASDTFSSWGR